jgi:hypothetical protein
VRPDDCNFHRADSAAAACSSTPCRRPGVALANRSLRVQDRCVPLPEPQRRRSLDQIDALNLEETRDSEAEVGSSGHHEFHTSAAGNVLWLRGRDCQDDGRQGCIAARRRIRNPDDSVLHQSWRKEAQCTTARRARAGEADSPAASCETEADREEALTEDSCTCHRSPCSLLARRTASGNWSQSVQLLQAREFSCTGEATSRDATLLERS